jgi:galactokinase
MIFGACESLLHARFYDLKLDEIPASVCQCTWPVQSRVVVVNSRVVRKLADSSNAIAYALPRLGCAIALPILRAEAASRGADGEDVSSWSLQLTLDLLKVVPSAASLPELVKLFPCWRVDMEAAVQRLIPGGEEALKDIEVALRASTLFVLAECARSRDFYVALVEGDLQTCGKLMDIGHEGDALEGILEMSDADLDALAKRHVGQSLSVIPGAFRAGHARLDELCVALRSNGAEGASLTGAGRGGCVVGLFKTSEGADKAAAAILRGFEDLEANDVIVVAPIAGRGYLEFD